MSSPRTSWGTLPYNRFVQIQAIGMDLTDDTSVKSWIDLDKAETLYKPISLPKDGDWLQCHPEAGQTFQQFKHSGWVKPDEDHRVIYLLPIDSFTQDTPDSTEQEAPSLNKLIEFMTLFFPGMQIKSLPVLKLENENDCFFFQEPYGHRTFPVTTRMGLLGLQLLTADILDMLKVMINSPCYRDGYCFIAITMLDLFPNPSQTSIIGESDSTHRIAVTSFSRYRPSVENTPHNINLTPQQIILHRSCKRLAHETSHLLGLLHCVYFSCGMNGSNNLEETDNRPIHFCPVDLHKLHWMLGFNIEQRYKSLWEFYLREKFTNEALWVETRLNRVLQSPDAKQYLS